MGLFKMGVMENKEIKTESSMKKIKNILITLTNKTGFDHSPLALEAFAQAESDIQSEIDLAVAKREKDIAGDITQIALDSWLEAKTLRMNVDGTATPEVDLEKMHKILLNKLITNK